MKDIDHEGLRKWFFLHKRDLPWRIDPSPYRVWISEVMLQQTKVSVVIPYFQRWMQLFPTISALAKAPFVRVIKAWEGLGYYSRVRNLHVGARYVLDYFGGTLPTTYEKLQKIKGLGPYTIRAVLCFAFKQREAPVDGNIFRVLSRYFGIMEDFQSTKGKKGMEILAQQILPQKEPWIFAEALMELGALTCQRTPRCSLCPLMEGCKAYQKGITHLLPYKRPRPAIVFLNRIVVIICSENAILLKKGHKGRVMADLWEFPFFDAAKEKQNRYEAEKSIWQRFSFTPTYEKAFPIVTHSFTRFKVRLFPYLFTQPKQCKVDGYKWISKEEIQRLPFSSGHRRIIQMLHLKENKMSRKLFGKQF